MKKYNKYKHYNSRYNSKCKAKKIKISIYVIIFLIFSMTCLLNLQNLSAYLTENDSITNKFTIKAEYTITFDSNSGEGTMANQVISYNIPTNLTANTFSKEGCAFSGWNTEANGSGTSYTDGQQVTNLGDITLYAQWQEGSYRVVFHANGGTGTMQPQVFGVDEEKALTTNSFTRDDNTFVVWSTTPDGQITTDGKGRFFSDGEVVKNLSDTFGNEIDLYAFWSNEYTYDGDVEFDGTNMVNTQIPLFSSANKDKDFVVSFMITDADSRNFNNSNQRQRTVMFDQYVGEQYQGMVLRWNGTQGCWHLEAINRSNKKYTNNTIPVETTENVVLIRKDGVLYFRTNNGAFQRMLDFSDFNSPFGTTLRFGAAIQNNGTIIDERQFYGKLSNLQVKLSDNLDVSQYAASWTDEYTIKFHSNNGQDQTDTQTVKFDQKVQLNENTFTNGDMVFKEWTTNPDGSGIKYINKRVKYANTKRTNMTSVGFDVVNLPVDKNLEVHLYAQWQEPNLTKTTFDKGQAVNVKMKKLAGNNTPTYSSTDTNIKYIEKATSDEFEAVKSSIINNSDNKVTSSYYENYYDKPIYMWFDNGKIYYYSEADIIYLNETNSYLFNGLTELISADLSGIDSSIVQNTEYMFGQCEKLETLDLRNFNTSAAKITQYMFNACESLISLDVSSFNTCRVENMRNMFSSCKNLQTLDITNFNTFNVTNMSKMFDDMYKIETLDLSSFDTRNVTQMMEMFETTKELKFLDLSNFDTSKVTTMQSMFNECQNLKSLDLSNFNTNKVTTMSQMFSNCTSLESLNLSGFSYESITDNNIIQFRNLTALKELNLTNFNAGNVTNMSQMFYNLTNLEELNLTNFKTTSATNMASMFAQCTKLKKLDLSSFDTSNVTLMNSMFNNCASLTELDISSFNTSNVTDINRMFASCETLTSLDVSSFDTSSVTNMEKMFSNMKNLETIYASDNFVTTAVTNGNQMFVYDTYHPYVDQPSAKLTGGNGTKYDKNHLGKDYARIDGILGNPGYFTRKSTTQ